jgi:gluconokinase
VSSKFKIIGIDIGTSSIRAALFDDRARQLRGSLIKREFSLETTPDGGSEVDAEHLFKLLVDVVDELHTCLDAPVEYIASCAFWHSLMGVDSNGKPTTKLFTWADTRPREYTEKLRRRFDENEIHNRTGARFHSSFWPAKLLWLNGGNPTAKWLSLSDYLQLRLCGDDSTSISMASATGLFDQHKQGWDGELLRYLKIKRSQLPKITNSSSELLPKFKKRWPRLKDAKWLPSIGDGAANNIGSSCAVKNRATLMVGTSGAMRVVYEGEPPKKLPSGLWCYRVDEKRVIVGGALSDGGGLYAYLRNTSNIEVSNNAIAREIARRGADAHGLTVMPFFFGERSTGYNEDARGYILGLSASHDMIDIIQAAMEAVAFRFAEILDQLKKVAKIDEIYVAGGALDASPVWTQIIADVLGRDLIVSSQPEASLRGAVLLALESLGKIDSIESFSQEKRSSRSTRNATRSTKRPEKGTFPRTTDSLQTKNEHSDTDAGDHRHRHTFRKHDPHAFARRGAKGELGASRPAAGDGSRGICFVDEIPAAQSSESEMVQPRSLSPECRARLDAALFAAPFDGL